LLLTIRTSKNLKFRKLYLLFFILLIFSCSGDQENLKTEINGYDIFNWNMNIEEVKKTISEKQTGILFEYISDIDSNIINYKFHSGNYKNHDVEHWDIRFAGNKLSSLTILFKSNKHEELFSELSESLLKKKQDNKKPKGKISAEFYFEDEDNPVTKLDLEIIQKENKNFVVLKITNLNNK